MSKKVMVISKDILHNENNNGTVVVISHADADGLMSAAIIARYEYNVNNKNVLVRCDINATVDKTIEMIEDAKVDLDMNGYDISKVDLYVTDRAFETRLEKYVDKSVIDYNSITVIDHHVVPVFDIDTELVSYNEYRNKLYSASIGALLYVRANADDAYIEGMSSNFIKEIIRVDLWDTFSFKSCNTVEKFEDRYGSLLDDIDRSYEITGTLLSDDKVIKTGNHAVINREIIDVFDAWFNASAECTPFSTTDNFTETTYADGQRAVQDNIAHIIGDVALLGDVLLFEKESAVHRLTIGNTNYIIIASKWNVPGALVSSVFDTMMDNIRNLLKDKHVDTSKYEFIMLNRTNVLGNIVNIRSTVDVVGVAMALGGGGHPNACGFTFNDEELCMTECTNLHDMHDKYCEHMINAFIKVFRESRNK